MEAVMTKLERDLKRLFRSESSGHDIYHLKRVLNLAEHIQAREGGDKDVIKISAFLHDVHRIMQKETGKYCSPKDSLSTINRMLKKAGVDSEKIPKILHCIEFHEEYDFSEKGKTAKDKETLIVQDADNLDAIGAVGIGRVFAYGGANSRPMWSPELPFGRKTFDEAHDDPSTIHHFHSKLLRLKGNMNTRTGKAMAVKRHAFMEKFLEEFLAEWDGRR